MFRLVINPKMKNSAVTVINGITNPGEVRAADCLVCVAIEGLLRFLFKVLSQVRGFFLRSGQDPTRSGRSCPQFISDSIGESGHFTAHNTIRQTMAVGSGVPNSFAGHKPRGYRPNPKFGYPQHKVRSIRAQRNFEPRKADPSTSRPGR